MSIEKAQEKLISAQTLIIEALRELPQPKPPRPSRAASTARRPARPAASAGQASGE